MDEKALALAKAIRRAETGNSSNPYQAKGASGESGAYQFMPATWRQWSKQYLGVENAPLTVENQNKVAYSRIKELKDQGYKPSEIASMWNSGRADAYKQGKKGTNKYGVSYDVPAYVAKVSSYYKQFVPQQQAQPQEAPKPFRYDVPEDKAYKMQRLQTEAQASQAEADKYKGVGFAKQFGKEVLGNLFPAESGLVKTIKQVTTDPTQYSKQIESITTENLNLMKGIKDMESKGYDATTLKQKYNQNQDKIDKLSGQIAQYQANLPTNKQLAGQIGGTALDVGTLGLAKPAAQTALKSTKFFSKPTLKTVAGGAGIGYGYDVSQGLMDQENNPYTPGFGTAFGAGIGVLGRVGVATTRSKEAKFQDIVEKRAKELYKVENKYAKTRKGMEYSKDEGHSSRKRISETDVLVGAVDDTGTIRTKQKGGAIDQYREQTIGKAEGLVMKDLEREGASIDFKRVEQKVLKTIEDTKALPAGERDLAINKARKELDALRKEVNQDGMLPLTSLQREKVANYAITNYETPAEVSAYRKALARAYKELIEQNSSVDTKTTNQEIAKYLEDIKRLEKLDGTKVEGGKLGKYFAQTSGNIIGAAAGNLFGPIGSTTGAIIGGEVASAIKGGAMKRTFGKATGRTAPKSPILEKVKTRVESPRLALPAQTTPFKTVKTTGKTINLPAKMDQSNNFGNRNTTYNPINAINNNAIPKSVAQKTLKESGIVSQRKQMIDGTKLAIEMINERLLDHPGKKLIKFISKREGEFLDFIDPQTLPDKTLAQKLKKIKMIERNRKVSSVLNTGGNRNFEDPDEIKRVIEEYQTLKKQKEALKQDLKDLKMSALPRSNKESLESMAETQTALSPDEEAEFLRRMGIKNQEAFGAIAGIERDEEGNITFNPEKAALGIIGVAGVTKAKKMLPTKKIDLPTDAIKYKTKNDLVIKDIVGNKFNVSRGTVVKAGQGKGSNMIVAVGDNTYTINKGQFDNLKAQSVSGEAKKFAPELEGLEESVKGTNDFAKEIEFDPDSYNQMPKDVQDLIAKYEPKGLGESYNVNKKFIKDLNKIGWDADYDMDGSITSLFNKTKGEPTKYAQYTLPNGENYREILIKAPTRENSPYLLQNKKTGETIKEFPNYKQASTYLQSIKGDERFNMQIAPKSNAPAFKSSHWDEPNVISHLRMNDRTYNGKKLVFMEELQSDWAREGRSKGFINPDIKEPTLPEGWRMVTNGDTYQVVDKQGVPVPDKLYGTSGAYGGNRDIAIAKATGDDAFLKSKESGISNHPLLKNWQVPTIKRALKDAVDNGAEYFAWINGDQTSARYNLATYVDDVKWYPDFQNSFSSKKTIHLQPKEGGGKIKFEIDSKGNITPGDRTPSDWKGKKLDEVLGKGLADKIMADESGTLSGEGLKFGGEWTNNLYDKQVKNIVEDLTGAKVKEFDLGLPVDKKKYEFFVKQTWDVGEKAPQKAKPLTEDTLKVGKEIYQLGQGDYIITDVLGDGKFKAVPKKDWESKINTNPGETFDISQKQAKQLGIELTPEVKAIINGESPLKNEGKIRQDLLLAGASLPLIYSLLMNNKE